MGKQLIHKKLVWVALILLLSVPTFVGMLRFGTFTMHDFHIFRLQQFDKCIRDQVFPCRWAADSGKGYGEPLFNFYPQLSYFVGEPFVLLGLSIVNSNKISFIFSLAASAVAMFFLSHRLWKDKSAALLSSLVYLFAPYRAVDVWVRGALPESLAFVFYPLIIYFLESYIEDSAFSSLTLFSLSLAGLLLTHHLSLIMFLIFLIPWSIIRTWQTKKPTKLIGLTLAVVLSIGITAFQTLPVLTEMKFVTLSKTTEGYYDFRAHFVTLRQLFLSHNWGYGASTWGDGDNLNLSIGYLQWTLPLIGLIFFFRKRSPGRNLFFFCVIIGIASLFLTHNKSTFIWLLLPFLSRLQFPWRFLSIALFALSLSSGFLIIQLTKNKLVIAGIFIALAMIVNSGFFKPDRWLSISDEDYFQGGRWNEQRSSALDDFWPSFGSRSPTSFSPPAPRVISGSASVNSYQRNSHSLSFIVDTSDPKSTIEIPTVYFPGWTAYIDNVKQSSSAIQPERELGLITLSLSRGTHQVLLKLQDTPVRKIGNLISLLSLWMAGSLIFRNHHHHLDFTTK